MTGFKSFVSLIGMLLMTFTAAMVQARTISYQAVLYDSTGGTQQAVVPMVFGLYDSPSKSSDGARSLLWSESHPNVSVSPAGLFSVELGSLIPFADSLFERELWLEITVDGQTISPRTQLGGSPYSFVSKRVSGDIITSAGELRVPGLDTLDWIELNTRGFTFPTKTECYVIPPCGGWIVQNGSDQYTYNCNNGVGSIYAWATSGLTFDLVAQTHLPLGATIIRMEVFARDSDADQDMQFNLVRVSHDASNQPVTTNLASVSSSGSGGTWQKLTVNLSHEIVDLSDTTYVVEVDIPAGNSSILEWGIVKICYTMNRFVIRK